MGTLVRGKTLLLVLSFGVISGCTNNINVRVGVSQNTIQASSPNANAGSGAFPLTRVAIETTSPPVLNLIGDGTGLYGSICLSSSGNSAYGATTCNCVYSYSSSSAPNQVVEVPTIYHESDLIRCSYASIPSGVTSIQVAIHLTTADTTSNAVNFTFGGTGVTLDTTLASSFAQVIRYQCRDVVTIPYLLDGNMYDPFQSDDPTLSYPLDFYTTSLGSSMATYVMAFASNPALKDWDCPTNLNPAKYLSAANLAAYNSTFHMNMNVYSIAPLNGSKMIYPPTPGIFDRSTFYLAKKATGIFTIPVNAYIAPTVVTSSSGTSGTLPPPPIGYAASSVSGANGLETCPDLSSIPPKFHWVKIWPFRASLPRRTYASSTDVLKVGSFACNPGDWIIDSTDTSKTGPVFPSCHYAKYDTNAPTPGKSISLKDLTTDHFIADRIMGNQVCVNLDNWGFPGNSLPATCLGPGPGCNNGLDYWQSIVPQSPSSQTLGCEASRPDPFNVCPVSGYNAGSNAVIQGPAMTPYSTKVNGVDLDTSVSRYDFLFVVTPPSLTMASMMDMSSNSPSNPYHPYRFRADVDCLSPDPDSPTTSGDCLPGNTLSPYLLKLHDINTNGDAPASDPNRGGIYPLCALQPDL